MAGVRNPKTMDTVRTVQYQDNHAVQYWTNFYAGVTLESRVGHTRNQNRDSGCLDPVDRHCLFTVQRSDHMI